MTDAKLVLLDEPAAGVNRTLLRKLEEKILILNRERGYTFILIEHDMEMIEKLCAPVVCMAEGRVLIDGIDQRQLGVGFTDINNGDVLHGMWNTFVSGVATGSLLGWVSMMSAICAHHFCITGCSGS